MPFRIAKIQNTTPYADKDVEQQKLSLIAGGNIKWYGDSERQLVGFL